MNWKALVTAGACASAGFAFKATASPQGALSSELPPWKRITTSEDGIPGTDKNFGSFNQPSVNRNGVVVFRARSVGAPNPVSGIFLRRMGAEGQPIEQIFVRGSEVPEPNNSDEQEPGKGSGSEPTGFIEFPSIPRIDADSEIVATRGNSTPVWIYPLEDGSETRVGTTGVYVSENGVVSTAMSQLGAVRDATTGELVFPWYQVPDAPEGTRFDVFPGSPSIANGRYIVTKANWTDPDTLIGKTGIFVRDLHAPQQPMRRLASSETVIPGQDPKNPEPILFGSTAPPSAADGVAVFLAVDNEEFPTMGGIYAAPLEPGNPGLDAPGLDPLVLIGDAVPGAEEGDVFTRIGEGLSFSGRFVAFWGAWGTDTFTITLDCPVDGNPDRIAFCNDQHPAGYTVEMPVHQGVFVYDLATRELSMAGQTGVAGITDMVYWNFSGRVPGAGGHGGEGGGEGEGTVAGEKDGELARWRSASFIAVESLSSVGGGNGTNGGWRVAFKAKAGKTDAIYMLDGPSTAEPEAILSTAMAADVLDGQLSGTSRIATLALERDSLRDGWFVISASTIDDATGEGFAGIYSAGSRLSGGDFNGDGRGDVFWHSGSRGRSSFWSMDGLTWNQGGYTNVDPGTDWVAQGSGDFDGDGSPDILWRDARTGEFIGWLMSGGELLDEQSITSGVEPWWRVVGVGDLNGDRRADVVFRSDLTGEVRGWLMAGLAKSEGGAIGDASELVFLGMGDLDNDTRSDLLWQRADGTVEGWRMSGLGVLAQQEIANAHAVASNWRVAAVGDLDGDSHADVLWHDPSIGWVAAWKMDGLMRAAGGYISQTVGPGWSIIASPDLDGDGRKDVLWQNESSGAVSGWLMNGFDIVQRSPIRSVELDWRPVR